MDCLFANVSTADSQSYVTLELCRLDSVYLRAGLYQGPVLKCINILCQTAEMWNQDDGKATGSLRRGFDTRVLPTAPPSFVSAITPNRSVTMTNCSVTMTHEIELIGYRSGALRRNKRVSLPITVLPQVVQADTSLLAAQNRWDGA